MEIQAIMGFSESLSLLKYIQVSTVATCLRDELINDLIVSEFVDATTLQEEKARFSKVGEVIVKVYRKNNTLQPGGKKDQCNNFNSYEDPVNEKALKGEAKSHGIAYGLASSLLKLILTVIAA